MGVPISSLSPASSLAGTEAVPVVQSAATKKTTVADIVATGFPVTTAKIQDLSVTSAKLASGAAVANIGAAGITSNELASNAVTTVKIADANVTTVKIADANVTPAKLSQPLTQGTAVASTSGTAIDFTGIPSWAKRVTVMFYGVSTSGTSLLRIRLGTSSGVETTGYIGDYNPVNLNSYYVVDATDGIPLNAPATVAAANTYSGAVTFVNISGNKWIADGGSKSSTYLIGKVGGFKELSGILDRIRITTVNGTDTFDAGSINILYE